MWWWLLSSSFLWQKILTLPLPIQLQFVTLTPPRGLCAASACCLNCMDCEMFSLSILQFLLKLGCKEKSRSGNSSSTEMVLVQYSSTGGLEWFTLQQFSFGSSFGQVGINLVSYPCVPRQFCVLSLTAFSDLWGRIVSTAVDFVRRDSCAYVILHELDTESLFVLFWAHIAMSGLRTVFAYSGPRRHNNSAGFCATQCDENSLDTADCGRDFLQ